jgi:alpha-D-ribose 1-methylphosphonate 5-triphosphate diphosphatase
MNLTVFKNAGLVLPNEVVRGSLSVSEGKISSVDQGLADNLGGWDVEGDYLMPGFVEMHTDNFERHLMPRPKVQWAEMPALIAHDAEVAAAGITTVFDALGVGDADPTACGAAHGSRSLKPLTLAPVRACCVRITICMCVVSSQHPTPLNCLSPFKGMRACR